MGNDRGLRQMKSVETSVKEVVWLRYLARAEYLLLCALALVLPLFETPKNLLVFLLLLAWVARRIVARDWGLHKMDGIGVGVLFLLASSLASTVANWPLEHNVKGVQHALMQALVFWLIYRGGYSERQRLRIAAMVVIGVIAGLGWGIVEFTQGKHEFLELHSVGGVIESAVYLSVALAMTFAVAWTRTTLPAAGAGSAAPWWAAVAVMLVGLYLMGNRGAILAVLAAGVVYALIIRRRSFWLLILSAMALVAVFTTMLPDWFNQSRWLAKVQEVTATGQLRLPISDQGRLDHWRIGAARLMQGDAWVLGIGPHNSVTIDYRNMPFDPPIGPLPERLLHLHNMFLTQLVEQGVVGLAAMLFFFGAMVVSIVRDHRRDEWRHWAWFAAVGAVTAAVVAGLVGPRWHQEQALLVMLVLALYAGSRREAMQAPR